MKTIFHLVGAHGSGKSTLAEMIGKSYEARGKKCAGIFDPMSEFIKDREHAIKHWPDADVIFIEHLPEEAFNTAKGDKIIRLLTVEN